MPKPIANHYLDSALQIAGEAGLLLKDCYGKLRPGQIQQKGHRDLVTEMDVAIEKQIVHHISHHFPDHNILAEENTNKDQQSNYQWFIDPIDGTNNFAHGHPFFAISIAMAYENKLEVGVVHAPILGEVFYAVQGKGAYVADTQLQYHRQIQVSNIATLKDALLATGFAYKRNISRHEALDALFFPMLNCCCGVRRCGSAAIDLCYVARGRYDGFWEVGLNAYDIAAGMLIVREAGGLVTDWHDQPDCLHQKHILASNGKIHQNMREYFQPIVGSELLTVCSFHL